MFNLNILCVKCTRPIDSCCSVWAIFIMQHFVKCTVWITLTWIDCFIRNIKPSQVVRAKFDIFNTAYYDFIVNKKKCITCIYYLHLVIGCVKAHTPCLLLIISYSSYSIVINLTYFLCSVTSDALLLCCCHYEWAF